MIGKWPVPLLLPLFLLIIGACSQKQEETFPEEEYLTEEELGLLEEPELESVEEEILEEDLEVIPEDPEEVVEAAPAKRKPSIVKKAGKKPVASRNSTARAPAPGGGDYVVQVGIYSDRDGAEAMRSKMSDMGYTAYIAAIDDPVPSMPGRHYRVRLGYFPSIEAANAFGDANLLPNNIKYWVDHKSRDGHTTGAPAAKKPVPAKSSQSAPASSQTKIIEQPQKPEPKASTKEQTPEKEAAPQKQPAKKSGGGDFDDFGGDDWGETTEPVEQPAKTMKKMPASTGKEAVEEKPAAPGQDGEKPAEASQEPADTSPAKSTYKSAPQKTQPKTEEDGGDDWEVDEGDWDLD